MSRLALNNRGHSALKYNNKYQPLYLQKILILFKLFLILYMILPIKNNNENSCYDPL